MMHQDVIPRKEVQVGHLRFGNPLIGISLPLMFHWGVGN
jgi:hypothetical protein